MPRAKKEVKTEFTVVNEKDEVVRVYSVENHGENAKEFAESFANKVNGSVK